MTKKQIQVFSDQIRAAIDASSYTRAEICRACDIEEGSMSRFMNGRGGIQMAPLDRIAAMLGINVCPKPKPKKKK